MIKREFVAQPVEMFGGNSRYDVFGNHIEALGGQPAGLAHRRKLIGTMNNDTRRRADIGFVEFCERVVHVILYRSFTVYTV